MSKAHPPELKNRILHFPLNWQKFVDPCKIEVILPKYMDKKITLKLNGARMVTGILRGFDPFMNLVIDEGVENTKQGEQNNIGMVVVRGGSIILIESMDRV